ncbi:MAG: hypothetical protein WC306_01535 [Candidatus Paceibacterota bacterium]|jgi:hypothetical protein
MNKTKYIILTLALCFSLVLVAYPLKTFATLTEEQLADIQADLDSIEAVTNPTPVEETPTPSSSDNGDGNEDNGGDEDLYDGPAIGSSISLDAPAEDMYAAPSPGSDPDVGVGDTWVGPSGQEYEAVEPSQEIIDAAAAAGVEVAYSWVPVEEDGGNGPSPSDNDGEDDPTPPSDNSGCGGCGQPACPVVPVTPPLQYRCSQCRCQ